LPAPEARRELEAFTKTGTRSVKPVKRAAIILAPDTSEGRVPHAETRIAARIGVSRQTVQNVKKDFEETAGPAAFLRRKKRETPPVPAKVTGEAETRIMASACSKPPEGFSTWTLRLSADTCVELQYADSLPHMTVSRLLKKRRLNPIREIAGRIPPRHNRAFAAAIEDVLCPRQTQAALSGNYWVMF
jgi:transposase